LGYILGLPYRGQKIKTSIWAGVDVGLVLFVPFTVGVIIVLKNI
jgi:hypothetical protein